MSYWLMKVEPDHDYSYDDLVRDGRTDWDGVRNYQARNNLKSMQNGDLVLIYHSGKYREVVGVARVTREAFPDPTTDDPRWVAVEIEPVARLPEPVSLKRIKETPSLADTALVRQSRLSVMPMTDEAFRTILALGGLDEVPA